MCRPRPLVADGLIVGSCPIGEAFTAGHPPDWPQVITPSIAPAIAERSLLISRFTKGLRQTASPPALSASRKTLGASEWNSKRTKMAYSFPANE